MGQNVKQTVGTAPPVCGDGFDEFVVAQLPRLMKLGRRMSLSHEESEDVALEALSRAFARWPVLKDADHRDAWVVRVAANVAVDGLRRESRVVRPVAARSAPPPDDTVVERAVIGAALRKLAPRQREALVLRYFADQSVGDVATAMNTSANTVKRHLARGLAQLRNTPLLREELT